MRPPALIFDLPIVDVTMAETVEMIGRFVDDGRREQRTHQIATVNVDFLVNALGQPVVADILRRADACLADGTPILWAARALDMPLTERVAGADLVPLLVDRSQTAGWRIHFFGSAPHVAERATALLRERFPAADFSIDPGPKIADPTSVDPGVLAGIAERDPDILCVALGNPKQELFIRAHRQQLGTPVLIGVGGSLDLLVGERKRAPVWAQRIGLEWVVRAVQEPARLGPRYARDIRVFGPRLASQVRSSRRRRGAGSIAWRIDGDIVELTIRRCEGPLPRTDLAAWAAAAEVLEGGGRLHVRGDGWAAGDALDDRQLAGLVGLGMVARRVGGGVTTDADAAVALLDRYALR